MSDIVGQGPNAPLAYIDVYCQEPEYLRRREAPPRRTMVVSLVVYDECLAVETARGRKGSSPREPRRPSVVPGGQGQPLWFQHDAPIPPRGGQALIGQGRRYRFECRLCHFTLAANEDRLFAVARRLRHAGVSEVSLRARAARVAST